MTGLLEQESKQGQKESGQQKTKNTKKIKKNKLKNKSVDQAEGMLHLRDIIKTQARRQGVGMSHISSSVLKHQQQKGAQ